MMPAREYKVSSNPIPSFSQAFPNWIPSVDKATINKRLAEILNRTKKDQPNFQNIA
jgi:hypothetical protein